MIIDIFKEKSLDLLMINSKSVIYFKIAKEKAKIKILKSEKIETLISSQRIFYLSNLEEALRIILKKYKVTELGIILNLPNIIFQRINLTIAAPSKEALLNYLKTNIPLPIEKYNLFFKQDKYKTLPNMSTFNVFLVSKEIIDSLLSVIEKHAFTPIFISPSIEIIFQYLINKTIIDFNEEYLIFVLEEGTLTSLLIRNLRLEKVILEEYDPEKLSLDLLILRIYSFLKTELKPTTKIIFFMEKRDFPEITQEKIFLPSPSINVFLEGGYFAFANVFTDKQIIDFLPLKNYTAYFLNRLPSIVMFLSAYLFTLLLLISVSFFVFQNMFKKEIKNLALQMQTISSKGDLQTQIENLQKITSRLKPDLFSKFSSLEKIKNIPGFESLNFSSQEVVFSLRVESQDAEKIKFQISQDFPDSKLIEETTVENKVLLKYSF
jgi:hypothetical protein